MALQVKHAKTSAIADGGDANMVQPSDWNADHTIVGFDTVVDTTDIGTAANQVPLCGYLGQLAFANSPLVTAPSTATSSGTTGDMAIDTSYVYFCVAPNTWKRVAISTW